MPTLTNVSGETFFVPALGKTLTPGESVEVEDVSQFVPHPFLKVSDGPAPAVAPVAPPAPEVQAPQVAETVVPQEAAPPEMSTSIPQSQAGDAGQEPV